MRWTIPIVASVEASSGQLAKRLKAVTDLPVVMGFGVSTPAQAAEIAADADGVVVASAIMRQVLDGASPESAGAFVGELRTALDGVAAPMSVAVPPVSRPSR